MLQTHLWRAFDSTLVNFWRNCAKLVSKARHKCVRIMSEAYQNSIRMGSGWCKKCVTLKSHWYHNYVSVIVMALTHCQIKVKSMLQNCVKKVLLTTLSMICHYYMPLKCRIERQSYVTFVPKQHYTLRVRNIAFVCRKRVSWNINFVSYLWQQNTILQALDMTHESFMRTKMSNF